METIKKIIHIDMDAFYASVEQRDQPDYRGKPVVVGGDPNQRGVVSTASYEARKFGIHSAMPSRTAFKLCPQAIFVRPRMEAYKKVSHQIRNIFFDYTDLVEPLSLDEAYLDVTINKKNYPTATEIAKEIVSRIEKETGLTASAGVSFNKMLAKIASDYRKPNGITVIPPKKADAFIAALPIRKFFGVGKVTEQKMLKLGIRSGADLKKRSLEDLTRFFGKSGTIFYHYARGKDGRTVSPDRVRKSIGREQTLHNDTVDNDEITSILKTLSERVSLLLKKNQKKAHGITLKIKYHDFQNITRSLHLEKQCNDQETLFQAALSLLQKTEAGHKPIRLLGISTSRLISEE